MSCTGNWIGHATSRTKYLVRRCHCGALSTIRQINCNCFMCSSTFGMRQIGMKAYAIITFHDTDSAMAFGWGSMFMEFCESGLMQIRLSLVCPIVRKSYPKGRLETILMVGFLIRDILSANMSGILLNELLVFINWLFIDKVLNFQDLRHIFIDMVSPACWYTSLYLTTVVLFDLINTF